MAKLMNIPILGIVENMSYFKCPSCNEKHNIFGESHIEKIAEEYSIKAIAKMPIDTEIAKACDLGKIEDIDADYLKDIADVI